MRLAGTRPGSTCVHLVCLLPLSTLQCGYDRIACLPHCPHLCCSERSLAAAAKYYELAQSKGLSLAQLALAWCKSRWYVASTM